MYNNLDSFTFCSTAISLGAFHANHRYSLPLVLSHPVGNPQMTRSLTTPHLLLAPLASISRLPPLAATPVLPPLMQSSLTINQRGLNPRSLSTIQSHDTTRE
jgi:hypothetical protein